MDGVQPETPQRSYRVTSPMTGEVLAEYDTATDADVEALLARTVDAQREWAARTVDERASVMRRVADEFGRRAEELAGIATREMGKKTSSGLGEVTFAVNIFTYYATEGPALIADQELPAPAARRAVVERRPIGTVLGVMPWNYPYYQVARCVAPNLLLGNAVIIKHAENCPGAALAIEEILQAAGVPAGVYSNVFASHEQVGAMIADDRVHGVSLTGSERAGRAIAEQAGRALKKVVLELGGSDPHILLDSDDVAGAARDAWRMRTSNAGQACNSNKRLIVTRGIADEFVATLVEEATGMEPGDPANLGPKQFPPLASRAAADSLAALLADAVAAGATLHVGGTVVEGEGAWFRPAVLTGVTPRMRAYHEEIFGPVAVVHAVDSDDDAVRLANDSRFGLAGAVFSTNSARAEAVAARLEVGMTHVNIASAEAADMPFGGTKSSGIGRELGPLGADEFANKRLYFVAG